MSRGVAPLGPARCARSTSCLLPWVTVAAPFARSINRCWLSSSCSTLASTRSHRDLMPCRSTCSSSSCTTSSVTPLIVPPRCRASRSALKRSRVSFTASNATGRPCNASVEPLARRCESICISVAVAVEAAACAAVRTSSDMMSAANTRNVTSRRPRTWNCRAIGKVADQRHLPRHRCLADRRADLLHQRHRRQRVVTRSAAAAASRAARGSPPRRCRDRRPAASEDSLQTPC